MKATVNFSCPHCESGYFNYKIRRTTERVGLTVKDGKVQLLGDGMAKNSVVTVECRNCTAEWDELELAEMTAEYA